LPFYPNGELTGWERTENKAVGTWRFLKDFGQGGGIVDGGREVRRNGAFSVP